MSCVRTYSYAGQQQWLIHLSEFALVLEKLETEFYTKAIAKFQVQDFIDVRHFRLYRENRTERLHQAGYSSAEVAVEQLQAIVTDEASHTSTLEVALKAFGVEPLQGCTFNLDSVLTDVATTMTAARLVEQVGVGAYLGAASLIEEPRILTAAASILTIEARHQTILNTLNGGATVPQAFDIPLRPEQVLAIAGGFISGCDLGVPANAPLAVTADGNIGPGTKLSFTSPAIDAAAGQKLFCNMVVGGAAAAISLPIDQCIVPKGIVGPVALFVTKDAQPLLGLDIADQEVANIVAGPTIAFVDFGVAEQTIARLVLTPGSKLTKDLNGAPPVATKSTATISPPEASKSVADSSSTGAPSSSVPLPQAQVTTVGTPPVLAPSQVFEGDVVPLMPSAGAEGPAPSSGVPTPPKA